MAGRAGFLVAIFGGLHRASDAVGCDHGAAFYVVAGPARKSMTSLVGLSRKRVLKHGICERPMATPMTGTVPKRTYWRASINRRA